MQPTTTKSILPSIVCLILSLSSLLLVYYRDPCTPSLRVASAVGIDSTLTALVSYLGLLVVRHHAGVYFPVRAADNLPSEGTLMASLAVGAVHGGDTYWRRGDMIRDTLPVGCVCLDDDGNVIARGGGLRKGDNGYEELCEGREGKKDVEGGHNDEL